MYFLSIAATFESVWTWATLIFPRKQRVASSSEPSRKQRLMSPERWKSTEWRSSARTSLLDALLEQHLRPRLEPHEQVGGELFTTELHLKEAERAQELGYLLRREVGVSTPRRW
jgi:hypothetical protein